MKNILFFALILVSSLSITMCTSKSHDSIPVGSIWAVDNMYINDTYATPPASTIPTLGFADSTKIGGSAGCNYYFGNYKVEPINKLTITPTGMTRMSCPNMSYESSFILNLNKVRSYTLKDSVLTLCDSLGKKLIILNPTKEELPAM
ncbi:MAG: META domain-containing protein [Bacteroidales bacterium]